MDKNRQRIDHQDPRVQGADAAMADRPGVPMEKDPRESILREPERMRDVPRVTRRMELRQMTPVFSTAFPPRGLSGALRRKAYRLPETHARHWMTLLFADRVELWEHRVARLVKLVAVVPMGVAGVLLAVRAIRARA